MMFSLMSFQAIVLFLLPSALSKSQNQCILVPLQGKFNPEATTVILNNDSITLIKVQRSNLLHYIIPAGSLQEQVYINEATNCSEVIGVIGEVDSRTASIVHTLARRLDLNITILSVVAPTTFLPLVNVNLANLLDMNPLIHYIQTLISFTDHLKWARVGLVSDGTYYYQFAAQLLQDQSERTLVPYILLEENSILRQALQTIQEHETRVIIVSVKKQTACSLLKEARKMDLIWPKYGWLVLDSESGGSIKSTCDLEGVIMIKDFSTKDSGLDSQGTRFERIASSVLLDSIYAITLMSKGMQISNASFEGETGLVKFKDGNRLNNISASQVINGSELEIARYDPNTQQLMLIIDILEYDTPRGNVLIIYNETTIPHIILFALLTLFCAVLVTVIFVLYLLFRNEREIKVTSVPISIIMFLGCYLQLSYIPVLLVKSYPDSRVAVPHIVTCQFVAWLGGTGISFPLILATVLMKMLRVYAIIQNPFSFKKKFFTDYMLLFYIALLLSPTILILTLWSSIDPLIIVALPFPNIRGQEILEICISTHTTIWLIIPYVYQAVLIVALVIVSLKTSSMRYKNLQDAGATNTFVLVAIASAFMGTVYGYLFTIIQPSAENYLSSEMTLSLSSFAIVISCQMLLFFPKVYYPVKRFLYRNKLKEKPVQNTSTP